MMDLPVSPDMQARKRALLESLYQKYRRGLLRFLNRQHIERETAAEIVQEVYVRMQRFTDVEHIEHPQAYLFRTASNLANDHRRYWQAQHQGHVDADTLELPSHEPSAYRILQGEQELRVVREALLELSPKCCRAFVMNRFEDASYEAIAAQLDISVSMVEKYISQALAHLRERVRDARPKAARGRKLK